MQTNDITGYEAYHVLLLFLLLVSSASSFKIIHFSLKPEPHLLVTLSSTDIMYETFSVDVPQVKGGSVTQDLKEDGRDVDVTEDNKVGLCAEYPYLIHVCPCV